ncbi:MAG: Rieske 2Fe-2S domain-containing protein [Chitinophagales bacterium]
MKIKYLGHAGFLVETEKTILLIDPWLSKSGAFDGGWFQYPCNHYLSDEIKVLFSTTEKELYVYISHEHKDHFDPTFLKELDAFDFTYLIPQYRRTLLLDEVQSFHASKKIQICQDEEAIKLPDSIVRIFIDDSELNRDSAILVSTDTRQFLNINDCKLHDKLFYIKETYGKIDVFAAQFSGATWHPVCYGYSDREYRNISRRKMYSKFESVIMALKNIDADIYLPSAGPPCFLDPSLYHLNFEEVNIFPHADTFVDYFTKKKENITTDIVTVNPSDSIDLTSDDVQYDIADEKRIGDYQLYIENYAKQYTQFFEERNKSVSVDFLANLKQEFERKLESFVSREKLERSLYIACIDITDTFLKVDFQNNVVSYIESIEEENYYLVKSNSHEFERVLNGNMTWEDLSLSFRLKLNRAPDVYQVLMQGFLILEAEDMQAFCDKILEIESREERITITTDEGKYSVNRYCPHQGADMKYAWIEENRYLVCPRHRWRYDLENDGVCEENDSCIHAISHEFDV